MLLVDARQSETEILRTLKDHGIHNVLSESTQPVIVSAWDKTETMSLADAQASLAPGDPRLDSYLLNLGRWFEAKAEGMDYRVFYIRDGSPFSRGTRLDSRISEAMGSVSTRFILPDAGSPRVRSGARTLQVGLAAFALLASAMLGPLFARGFRASRSRFPGVLGAATLARCAFRLTLLLPWLILANGGLTSAAISVLWGLAFAEFADKLDVPLEEFRSGGGLRAAMGSLIRQPLFPLSLGATALAALFVFPGALIPVLAASLGSLLAAIGFACSSSASKAIRTRRPFVPLPISRRRRGGGAVGTARMRDIIACAVIMLSCFGTCLSVNSGYSLSTVAYPGPVRVLGSARPLPPEARSRRVSESGDLLPGIAAYLEHRAFQEALPFIPLWESRVDPFAPIDLPSPDGRARTISFDDNWARRAYASLPAPSLEAMLIDQGGGTAARPGGEAAAVGTRPLAPIDWLLYILLFTANSGIGAVSSLSPGARHRANYGRKHETFDTFRHGGIKIDTGEEWSERGTVENAFLPNGAIIFLKQHAGRQARCVVRRGEYVREGMVIGRADGPDSANVHSSIPGVVRDIIVATLPEGGHAEAVVVALEGSFDRLGRRGERYLWKTMGRNEILATLRDRGVVDTELPGYPLFDLLGERHDIDMLIINAVETEPYQRAESRLLGDHGAEVDEGIAILHRILNPRRIVLAGNDALSASATTAPDIPSIERLALDPRHPQDMPTQLIEAIAGQRATRAARKQLLKGSVIVRPSTAFAIYEAVMLAKPMVERYVSISGGALKRSAVLKARIGTPIGDLIEECGGFLGPPARLVLRSALRGHAVHDLDTPITKTTSAVIALTSEEIGSQRSTPCIRCGRCAAICPEMLDPDSLYRLVERGLVSRAVALGLGSCTVCGSCGYVCPARIPLVAAFSSELRALSAELGEAIGAVR